MQGRGTFQNSIGIKQFAKEMIHRGHREFVVDLEECPVMDSTFMGTLTGVALQLRSIGQGQLHMVHCNHRNVDLLKGLGLDHIIDLTEEENANAGIQPLAATSPEPANRHDTTETMLAAHQALVDADPKNLSRFKDVLDYLKQDLSQNGNDKKD